MPEIPFWSDVVETAQGGLNLETKANFNASPASVGFISAPGATPIVYGLPSGYHVGGEGERRSVGEIQLMFNQPCLKGEDREISETETGWSMVPTILRLRLNEDNELEMAEEFELRPEVPSVDTYRDTTRWSGGPVFADGLAQAGLRAWGRIADCASPGFGGELHGVFRVNDWLFPQISNSNQAYARHLVTGEYWRLRGWLGMPSRVRREDPQRDETEPVEDDRPIDFGGYGHSRYWYNILGGIDGNRVLILVEEQAREVSSVSNFRDVKTEAEGDPLVIPVLDYFPRKWVNSSGTSSAEYGGDVLDYYEAKAYNWDSPDLLCGGILGEPWGRFFRYPFWADDIPARSQGGLVGEFQAALEADLDYLREFARFDGVLTTAATIELQIWEFPEDGSTPFYVDTIYTWDDATVEAPIVVRGASEYTITLTTLGGLPVVDGGDAYPGNYAIDWFSTETSFRVNNSSFDRGAGVMVHSLGFLLNHDGDERWSANSQDTNNCPGPAGPWLDKTQVDDSLSDRPVILTALEVPIVARPYFPSPAEWHPGKLVTDGNVAIFLPRESLFGPIRCLPLADEAPDWTVNTRAHINVPDPIPDPAGRIYGACISNGILTSQYLYCVIRQDGPDVLFKVRVRNQVDEDGAVVESAGTVVSVLPLPEFVDGSPEVYRDNLVAINRRCIAVGATQFFEITTA